MRCCDRHQDRRAVESVLVVGDDSTFDLCAECKTDLLGFLSTPEPEKPRKKTAKAVQSLARTSRAFLSE